MSKNKVFLGLIILLSFCIFVVDVSSVNAQTIEISNDETWNEDKIIEGSVIVNSGVTLTIAKGVSITFKGTESGISVHGKLIAKGTVANPVKFDLEDDISEENFYGITAHNGGEIFMTNAEVENGGYYYVPTYGFFEKIRGFFVKNTLAVYNTGAIGVEEGGKMEAEHCFFHDNKIGVAVYWGENYNESDVMVNRSKFENNSPYDVVNAANVSMNFKYNWWGSENGPDRDKIYGDIDTENYIEEENFHDPVIIVPGILGSWKITDSGEWRMDPILHIYDNLIASFKSNGYEEGRDLFVFPYQWRDSNVNTAFLLKQKIQDIKIANNWPKVDVVAHSMGGLVSRQYIESEDYQNDIDQLIMLGTPQWGAPKSYLMWEGEEGFYGMEGFLLKNLVFKQEAHEAGFKNIIDYLHNAPIESVKELLPTYDYLEDINSGEIREYPNNYPANNFLDNLNNKNKIISLDNIEYGVVIGNLENIDSTISKIKIGENGVDGLWEHGKMEEVEYGKGDGTVPKYSENFDYINSSADEYLEINSFHSDLPTKSQCYVIKNLTGNNDCEYVSTLDRIKNILTFGIFSPIDIQIISPSGQWSGKNIKNLDEGNQIEGAYYNGFETENEFLTVPNPEDGEYKIIIEGTGDGEYRIEMAKISEDENGTASEITGEISGTAENGIQEEKIVEVLEDEIITEEKDIIAPTITISSPQNKTYLSDEIVPIDFSITDDSSGVDEEKTKIFLDEKIFSQDKIDMAYLTKGEHNLKISAMDKAGNSKEEIIAFSIQPTIDSIIKNVEHYYQDKFITKKATKNYLDAKLRVIEMQKMLYDAINLSPWPAKFKNQLLKNLAKNINREVNDLIEKIQKEKAVTKNILEPARSILVGNLSEMKM